MDYVSKWVEAIATPKNYGNVVLNFLNKHIFSIFRTPRVIISNEGRHFCNKPFKALSVKYGVKHRITLAYHPQTNGQTEVSNIKINKILEKTVSISRKDWKRRLVMYYGQTEL